MNWFEQAGGYPATGMLVLVIGAAFSSPHDAMSHATRWTARLASSLIGVIWLLCVAEEALR